MRLLIVDCMMVGILEIIVFGCYLSSGRVVLIVVLMFHMGYIDWLDRHRWYYLYLFQLYGEIVEWMLEMKCLVSLCDCWSGIVGVIVAVVGLSLVCKFLV